MKEDLSQLRRHVCFNGGRRVDSAGGPVTLRHQMSLLMI